MSSDAFIGPEPYVSPPSSDLIWSSAVGLKLMRDILHAWPVGHDPHDFLLDWCAVVLEGRHLFATTATGDGKTCVFYYIIIIMLYFARRGWKPPRGRSWPKHPLAIIVCPVIGIEEQMGQTFTKLRLKNIVWNGDTLRKSPNLLLPAAIKSVSALILSPEMLRTPRFQRLLDIRSLLLRIALLGIDEVHLLLTWGRAFRQAFRQIGPLRSRLDEATRVVALTATIVPGREIDAINELLGLRDTDTTFIRQSNLRGNVRLERQVVTLAGPTFPDFDCFVSPQRIKTILFCGSISMAFRVATDLWPLLPPGQARSNRIRIYTSLYTNSYNQETRRLLEHHDQSVLVLATCALSNGINIPFVNNVGTLGVPESANQFVQETGRAGRGDRTRLARGIMFLPHGAIESAQRMLATAAGSAPRRSTKQSAVALVDAAADTKMSLEVASLVAAEYLDDAVNTIYKNPKPLLCKSEGCDRQPISGTLAQAHRQSLAEVIQAASAPRPAVTSRPRAALTKELHALVVEALQDWRKRVWRAVPSGKALHLTARGVVPDRALDRIVDRLYDFETADEVKTMLEELKCTLAIAHAEDLFGELIYARRLVADAKEVKAREAAEKRKETANNKRINAEALSAVLSFAKISPERLAELAEIPASQFYTASAPTPAADVANPAAPSVDAGAEGSTASTVLMLQDIMNVPRTQKGRKRASTGAENAPPPKRRCRR